jgi:hypothetical protein
VEEKYIQNEHLVDNIAEELVIILESSDWDMSEEDEDNSLEGILLFCQIQREAVMWTSCRKNQTQYF